MMAYLKYSFANYLLGWLSYDRLQYLPERSGYSTFGRLQNQAKHKWFYHVRVRKEKWVAT